MGLLVCFLYNEGLYALPCAFFKVLASLGLGLGLERVGSWQGASATDPTRMPRGPEEDQEVEVALDLVAQEAQA